MDHATLLRMLSEEEKQLQDPDSSHEDVLKAAELQEKFLKKGQNVEGVADENSSPGDLMKNEGEEEEDENEGNTEEDKENGDEETEKEREEYSSMNVSIKEESISEEGKVLAL